MLLILKFPRIHFFIIVPRNGIDEMKLEIIIIRKLKEN